MIESHVFGTKRSYRMQERNGQIEWVSNDSHLIKFNNLLQMWQVVNATTSNQIGEGKIQSVAYNFIFFHVAKMPSHHFMRSTTIS